MGQPITNPIFPFTRVARRFFQQTINQLEVNTMTQCIYPKEVYNGYWMVNQKRKEMGMWHSTGEGAKSFGGKIIEAGEGGKVTMAFSFNDYLRFAEMGVGKGTKYEDVQSGKKARYQTRYISKWNRKEGKSQRPAIMMELRHLQQRIANYLVDFYGYEGEVMLINTFEDASPIQLF
jgi:hypothetical protein